MTVHVGRGGAPRMWSDTSTHSAEESPGGWRLSWLPGTALTREQAFLGLMLAETVGDGLEPDNVLWPRVEDLAARMGLPGAEAARRAAAPRLELVDEQPQPAAHLALVPAAAAADGAQAEAQADADADGM